jgi:hypothetical protein
VRVFVGLPFDENPIFANDKTTSALRIRSV